MAMQYLERFYSKGQGSNKIAMGSAYKGFDDADASWGKGRVIDQQCGRTWLTTFAVAGRFYSSRHQLPALIIPTWNDYEEGTEIETGIENCVTVRAAVSDERLSWSVSGDENTLDHMAILAQRSSQWTDVADLPANPGRIGIRDLHIESGTIGLCVQAIGRASMLNHSSGAIELSATGKSGSD